LISDRFIIESGKVPFGNLIGFSVFLQDVEKKIIDPANPAEKKYIKSLFISIGEIPGTGIKRSRNNKIMRGNIIK
jgi:hypothetical protein